MDSRAQSAEQVSSCANRLNYEFHSIQRPFAQDFCTQPANMAGIPAVSLPIKISERGLPISLQLMAPYFDDGTLLDVALVVEAAVKFPHLAIKDSP